MLCLFVWGSQIKLYGIPTGLAASAPSDIMRVVMASSHGTIMDLGKEYESRQALKGERVCPVLAYEYVGSMVCLHVVLARQVLVRLDSAEAAATFFGDE